MIGVGHPEFPVGCGDCLIGGVQQDKLNAWLAADMDVTTIGRGFCPIVSLQYLLEHHGHHQEAYDHGELLAKGMACDSALHSAARQDGGPNPIERTTSIDLPGIVQKIVANPE